METASLLIVGTGALATLFAARTAAAGTDVTLLGSWAEGLAALRAGGARVDGEAAAFPVRATHNPAECRGAKYALVLVKAWQTERAAARLAECLAEDGLALTLQNGLGNREILARRLGKRRVALGVTTLGAALLGPGLVRPGGAGTVSLEKHTRLQPLAAMLERAGFEVNGVKDAEALLWGKLVVNAAINPLTALLRIPNGDLLDRPELRALMGDLAREVAGVAAARGVSLPFADPVLAVEAVARRTAENRSSMLQDVMRAAPTEVDAINGAVVRLGEKAGVPTPANRVLWSLVKSLELSKLSSP